MSSARSEAANCELPVLRKTLRLCEDALSAVSIRPGADVADRLVKAFVAKATRTLKAIILLYERGLCEEAQSLVRILFELHVNCSMVILMLHQDMTDACRRLLDSVMLAKIKQQRATHLRGLEAAPGAPSRQVMEKKEGAIASRYTPGECEALGKHGFSGKNMEQRCRTLDKRGGGTGFSDTYNVVYRNFSRNVHSTDIVESLLNVDPPLVSARAGDLVESRDQVACDVVLTIALSMVDALNREFGLGLDSRLTEVRRLRMRAASQ